MSGTDWTYDTVDLDLLRPVLEVGLRWLLDTEQPDGAINQQHHGIPGPHVSGRRFTFAPVAYKRRPVIVVEVVDQRTGPDGKLLKPLGGPAEVAWLKGEIQRAHRSGEVAETWNGDTGHGSASFSLAQPAHWSHLRTASRYGAGCPTHHTVFCSSDGCGWFASGNQAMVWPTWPDVAVAAAGGEA